MSTFSMTPEWMRRPTPAAENASFSPLISPPNTKPYSSILQPSPSISLHSPALGTDDHDQINPFKYSKEQMLKVWRDGIDGMSGPGAGFTLGLEVERWPGVVRDLPDEPVGVRKMTPEEKRVRMILSVRLLLKLINIRFRFIFRS
jgi:PERQ amino acid-rich with GYF domain-containing protein